MGTVVAEYSAGVPAVFLLADNRLLREALVRILSKRDDLRIVGAEAYSPEACDQITASGADVVVLDSVARVLDGHGAFRELHHPNPAMRIVMVGMEADESVFVRLIQAGVLGYVLKDASATEVARTIRAVAAGEAVCPGPLSAVLFRLVAQHATTVSAPYVKSPMGLSRREQQLLGLIEQGLTNKEMASRLHLSEQTIKNHVHRMLRKANVPDRLAMVDAWRYESHPV
jgi:two-component system, NarL family, response regulator DevR